MRQVHRAEQLLPGDYVQTELRFPRHAESVDSGSDRTHERNIDHGCPVATV